MNTAIFCALLFGPAGTLAWPRAWVILAILFFGSVASIKSLLPAHKDLLDERLKPVFQKGQPLADKILILAVILVYIGQMALIPLDVFRFHLLSKPPLAVSCVGLALFLAGWWIANLALLENRYATAVVKYQEERGQTVIDTGVYSVVRHPMYAGLVLFLFGLSLWLES
jgi:protein-S-isoprenylcysteine O-methyltransferase Ste14